METKTVCSIQKRLTGRCGICASSDLRFEGVLSFKFIPKHEYLTTLNTIEREVEIFVYVENNDFENVSFRDYIIEQFSEELNPPSGYLKPNDFTIHISGVFRCLICDAFSPMKNICPVCGDSNAYSHLGGAEKGNLLGQNQHPNGRRLPNIITYSSYSGITSQFQPIFWKKEFQESCLCGYRKRN